MHAEWNWVVILFSRVADHGSVNYQVGGAVEVESPARRDYRGGAVFGDDGWAVVGLAAL